MRLRKEGRLDQHLTKEWLVGSFNHRLSTYFSWHFFVQDMVAKSLRRQSLAFVLWTQRAHYSVRHYLGVTGGCMTRFTGLASTSIQLIYVLRDRDGRNDVLRYSLVTWRHLFEIRVPKRKRPSRITAEQRRLPAQSPNGIPRLQSSPSPARATGRDLRFRSSRIPPQMCEYYYQFERYSWERGQSDGWKNPPTSQRDTFPIRAGGRPQCSRTETKIAQTEKKEEIVALTADYRTRRSDRPYKTRWCMVPPYLAYIIPCVSNSRDICPRPQRL